jgi:hypothetical protein
VHSGGDGEMCIFCWVQWAWIVVQRGCVLWVVGVGVYVRMCLQPKSRVTLCFRFPWETMKGQQEKQWPLSVRWCSQVQFEAMALGAAPTGATAIVPAFASLPSLPPLSSSVAQIQSPVIAAISKSSTRMPWSSWSRMLRRWSMTGYCVDGGRDAGRWG